jgi:predicted nuclease with TOPRIM domain
MQEKLIERLSQLKSEFESGQKVLRELEVRQQDVRDTLLRIGGAIQVLEEMLPKTPPPAG